MKIQKQFVNKRGYKEYHKFVVVIPPEVIEQAGLKEGDELEAVEIKKGEMRLKRK